MRRYILIGMTLCATLFALPNAGVGQGRPGRPQARRRPATSPYLGLLSRNNRGGFASNYYRRVKPEIEFRGNDARLSRSVRSLQQRRPTTKVQRSVGSQLGATGHSTSFLSIGSYFPLSTPRR